MLFLLFLVPTVLGTTSMNYMQSQSALVAEMSLSGRMTECLLRSYCLVGAHSTRSGDIAQGIVESVRVFSQVLNSVEHNEKLTNMRKLKASFDLGATTKNSDLCSSVFRCKLEENLELVPDHARTEMPECDNITAVCPGASISCALCGMFLPGACTTVCPIAGIFCGASGYLCLLQPPAAP